MAVYIVSVPMENMDFPWLCCITRGYLVGKDCLFWLETPVRVAHCRISMSGVAWQMEGRVVVNVDRVCTVCAPVMHDLCAYTNVQMFVSNLNRVGEET